MNTVQISNEEKSAAKKEINAISVWANELQISNDQEQIKAQEFVLDLKKKRKSFHEKFDPTVRSAHAAWKAAKELYNYFLNPFDQAEVIVKRKIVKYQTEKERKEREEARKLEAKRQEEERKRQERLKERAKKEEEKGKVEKAEALRESAEDLAPPPPSIPTTEAPKAKGTFFRETWRGQVVDLSELMKAILGNHAPKDLLMPNQSAINKYAAVVKNTMTVPGLKVTMEKNFTARVAK